MRSALTKDKILISLPIGEAPLVVRSWRRDDLDTVTAWPNCPFPYRGFPLPFASVVSIERDQLIAGKQGKPNTIPLVVDHAYQPGLGNLSLTNIDWVQRRAGNFVFRIHPKWVNEGIGISVLRKVWFRDKNVGELDIFSGLPTTCQCFEKKYE